MSCWGCISSHVMSSSVVLKRVAEKPLILPFLTTSSCNRRVLPSGPLSTTTFVHTERERDTYSGKTPCDARDLLS